MLSWKERGEVPDSDDENDDDSHSAPDEGYGNSSLAELRSAQKRRTRNGDDVGHTEIEEVNFPISTDALEASTPPPQRSQDISRQVTMSSRVFKTSPSPLGPNQLRRSHITCLQNRVHVDDEISQSYVRLSPPLPSFEAPSAHIYPSRQAADTDEQDQYASGPKHVATSRSEQTAELDAKDLEFWGGHDEFQSTNKRRSLRQRNPIQLHPYALEGEKYRRTLMGRGLRPLRLAQVQEDRGEISHQHSSPEFDLEAEDESQGLNAELGVELEQFFQSSNPIEMPTTSSPDRHSTQSGFDDDDFPDIDQLLERSNGGFVQAGSKRRKITYDSRETSRISSGRFLPKMPSTLAGLSKESEMLNVPPSPPATSSPIPSFHGPHFDAASNTILPTLASGRAALIEYAESEPSAATWNLPTPLTNLVEHTIDMTKNQSDEDPSASDSNSSTVSQSSEIDKSVRVRRNGKKIRGVLPASWLRLDQQMRPEKNGKELHREQRTFSPMKAALSRRGVAIPRDTAIDRSPTAARSNPRTHFVLSDSESDDLSSLPGLVEESASDLPRESMFSQTDVGSVMEDDQVDAMLPLRKRQTKILTGTAHRTKRRKAASLFTKRHSGPNFQPKITEHLRKSSSGSKKTKRYRVHTISFDSPAESATSQQFQQSLIPKLSILDVVKPYGNSRERLPPFIRIAARNARSRIGLGRHSPTRKFIKLANRNDTQDAQSILRDWREGTLCPRALCPGPGRTVSTRRPLSNISNNISKSDFLKLSAKSDSGNEMPQPFATTWKTVVSRPSADPQSTHSTKPALAAAGQIGSKVLLKRFGSAFRVPKMTISSARPAQLETSEIEYGTRHPSATFGSTKKVLDTLYKRARKGRKQNSEAQLTHFIKNKYLPSHTNTPVIVSEIQESRISSVNKKNSIKPARRLKRHPQHVDANAAVFRQPSEPLVLDCIQAARNTQETYGSDGKLLGLGNFGTIYTYHFDIFPLHPGVFFHKSTFVGSGHLSGALGTPLDQYLGSDRGYSTFELAGKQLRWGLWNDIVSSEFGMCLDWIIEQLGEDIDDLSSFDWSPSAACVTHLIEYVQKSLSFSDLTSWSGSMSRLTDVLSCFTEQLELLAFRGDSEAKRLRLLIEVSCLSTVLSTQILKIAQSGSIDMTIAPRLETVIQRAAALTIGLLLSVGLAPIRNLYDDLQYEAYRVAGIRNDRYATQAWVIIMHTVYVAQIPRVSFWDMANAQLIKDDGVQLSDARILERIWYDMFSLLPLADFKMNGALVASTEMSKSFENWALPQKMAKKIFELYNSGARQSPGFNDYCRALFSRCNYLMQAWGWRQHGAIVGTLFDFFAARKLAHLRNEEVYRSPKFLEELNKDPCLVADSDDRCFHILLKIIAVSIKQMRESGDVKGIRNLVTRVLPNHDRQYPRDKVVHQRDLASLRNHHDLLCTLFWASPPELRPPIALIQGLVNPGSSHQEAYLINLRSWEILTRFVLASNPAPATFLPLAAWQNEFFQKLLAQYHSAETDVQHQVRDLPAATKLLLSQQTLDNTVRENKAQIAMSMERAFHILRDIVRNTDIDIKNLKQLVASPVFNDSIADGLGLFKHYDKVDLPVIIAALDLVHVYAVRLLTSGLVDNARKSGLADTNHKRVSEDDSQEYGGDVFDDIPLEILEYIGHPNGKLMASVQEMLRASLNSGNTFSPALKEKVLEVWALIAALSILAKHHDIAEFLNDSGPFNEFCLADQGHTLWQYAPRFLATLAKQLGDAFLLDTTGRDILSDWLCTLINPITCFAVEHELLPVLAKYDKIIREVCSDFLSRRVRQRANLSTLQGIKTWRVDLIQDTLQAMELILRKQPSEAARYRAIVHRMLVQMKADLCAINPQSYAYGQHERFVASVHSSLTIFFHGLSTGDLADAFFRSNSTYPRSNKSYKDPKQYCAIIRNYGLRLDTTRGRNELNHYILALLKHTVVTENKHKMSDSLENAMGNGQGTWRNLSAHVLTVLTPAFIQVAFMSKPGWLLAEPLLEASQEHLMHIADSDRVAALIGVSEIMSSIIDGITTTMEAHSDPITEIPNPVTRMRPCLVPPMRRRTMAELPYVLLLSTRFMVLAFDWLPMTMELCSEQNTGIASCQAFFYHFALGAKEYLARPYFDFLDSARRLPGPAYDDFPMMEELCKLYEEAVKGAGAEEDRFGVLKELLTRDGLGEKYLDDMVLNHASLASRAQWVFNHLRNSDFFSKAKTCIKNTRKPNLRPFSGPIVEEFRENWAPCSEEGAFEVKFGQEKHIVKGVENYEYSRRGLYLALIHNLDEYVTRYEKTRPLEGGRSRRNKALDSILP